MIEIRETEIYGWGAAIRGMRNPMESWGKSDSYHVRDEDSLLVGDADLALMVRLANAGPDHGKFLRMITVTADILAPLYWWKEFDTYKVGTVVNSCSTMHSIHKKEFTLDDFSHEHLLCIDDPGALFDYPCIVRKPSNANELVNGECVSAALECLKLTIDVLNTYRHRYIRSKNKLYWWQMIQLLPSSYNQRRTVQLNYAVLRNIYQQRKDHKLDEWRDFCRWAESLPCAKDLIVPGE